MAQHGQEAIKFPSCILVEIGPTVKKTPCIEVKVRIVTVLSSDCHAIVYQSSDAVQRLPHFSKSLALL